MRSNLLNAKIYEIFGLLVHPSNNPIAITKRFLRNRKKWKIIQDKYLDKLKYWSFATGLPLNNFQQLGELADNLNGNYSPL